MRRSDVILSSDLSRRTLIGGALGLVVAGSQLRYALAQATPVAGPGFNYPELAVTLTDDAVQLASNSVPAGYILLTVHNQSKSEAGAAVLGPGAGQTMNDLQQAAATPTPSDAFPPFFYTAAIPGGPGSAQPGETVQAIIQVTEGDWVVFSEGNQPPAFFTATAAASAQQAPTTTAKIVEVDFAFGGMAAQIPAGQQVWEVVNEGVQPHMLVLGQVPANTTLQQVMAAISQPPGATPEPGGLGENDLKYRGGVLLQSAGTTVWPMLDLPAGRYVAMCFVPDPNHGGMPHAMEGMVALFDVGGMTATPAS